MSLKFIRISAYRAWVRKDGEAMPGCKPYDTDFYSEMKRIQDGTYKPIIDECRAIKDKKARDKFKCEKLPSLTLSAVCRDWRKTENIIEYTNLLNLDIDQTGNEHVKDWGELRDIIFNQPAVVAAFLSASGQGISFVVKIDHLKHKDTFFSIVDEMKEHLNIKVDAGLHDYIRLRFVSYDPNCRIRENFEEIPIIGPSPKYLASKKNYGRSEVTIEPVGDADSEHNFLEAVKKAESTYAFQDGEKHRFLVSVAGTCNLMGMSEEFCKAMTLKIFQTKTQISHGELLDPVIRVYKSYRSQRGSYNIEARFEKLNKKLTNLIVYDYLHNGKRPTDEEILTIAKENDANIQRVQDIVKRVFAEFSNEFNYVSFPQITKVEIFLTKHYSFYYNVVTQQPEHLLLGEKEISPINIDEIHRQLLKRNFKFAFNNLKSLMKSDFMTRYDPIADYFNSLPYAGDGHIDKLSSYIVCEDQEFWQAQFKKAIVRCIPCGLGRQENRIVVVLQGNKQETGKSTFIRFLSPWGVEKYYSESPTLEHGKDSEFKFAENFLYNLEELAALNSQDIEKLKATISKRNIKERRAYAVFETEMARRCNFWASTNQDYFLQDFENTRWLIFKVQSINWDYTKDIDIHKVWAEAWHLYNMGFDHQLTIEERAKRESINEMARIPNSEEELIIMHYTPDEVSGTFITSSQIAGWLSQRYGIKLTAWKAGRAIKKLFGLDRISRRIGNAVVCGYYFTHSTTGLSPDEVKKAIQNWQSPYKDSSDLF